MLSPQAEKLAELYRNMPKQVDLDLVHQREAGEHQEDLSTVPAGIAYEDAPEVGGLWARPVTPLEQAAILYIFGGGYVISSPHSRRKIAGRLALATGVSVLVPNYRLAPEYPFPDAVEDVTAAYQWLLKQGNRPERTIIAGDSSGGGLAVAALLNMRDEQLPLPAGAVPISPWDDLACTGETMETNAQADLTVTKDSLLRMAGQYLHGADPRNPLASPLYGGLAGLPPLFIIVGGCEALLDDSVRLARKAGMASVNTTLFIGAGMQHVFPVYAGYLPEADHAISLIGQWVRERVS